MNLEDQREYDRLRRLSGLVYESRLAHRLKNPELYQDYGRLRRLAFPEEQKSYDAKSSKKHSKNRVARAIAWQRLNPAKNWLIAQKAQARRRARLKGATLGDRDSVSAIYDRCAELRKWFNVCVDHVFPLSKGGAHSARNLQIIYRSENASKSASVDYVPKIIFT